MDLNPPPFSTFQHDGLSIAYFDEGDAAGEPVLLIHGFASSANVNWVFPGWLKTLGDAGYRVIALYLEDKDNRKDPDLWWLHVEKTEVHTPDSLHERNQALYRFAEEHGLDAYDGMDVGAID